MSAAAGHPLKTELGQDELRRRTRGLSQRHRTMLLLVNGKRTRREVLTLAGQAGVGVEFFDELVAMGMVDPEPSADATSAPGKSADAVAERVFGAASEWPATNPSPDAPTAAPDPVVRDEPKAPPPPREPEALPNAAHKAAAVVNATPASGPPKPKRAAPPVLTLDDAVPLAATRAALRGAPAPAPAPEKPAAPPKAAVVKAVTPPAPEPISARMRFTPEVHKPKGPARRAPPVELRQEPRLTPAKPPAGRPARIKMLAPAGPLDDESELQLLAEVRSLLIGTLLVDGPVTSSLTALRVRKARNRYDLTALVWEIERTLVRAKRPREAQSRLSKARDLLGLGNTVTDEETSPGRPTES